MKKTISLALVVVGLAIAAGAQVPIPAELWLIGASLLGVLGFISRKPAP